MDNNLNGMLTNMIDPQQLMGTATMLDASHRHVCEAHLRINKSLTVNSLFYFYTVYILKFQAPRFLWFLGTNQWP